MNPPGAKTAEWQERIPAEGTGREEKLLCMKLSVLTAVRRPRFRSSQQTQDPYTVKSATTQRDSN